MKKFIILIALLLVSLPSLLFAGMTVSGRPCPGGGADYCASQAWATLTEFKLDFSHTTDARTACLTTGTELGVDGGTPVYSTPALVSPGSGGTAMSCNADGDKIIFDNTTGYFDSKWGEVYFMVNFSGDNTGILQPLNITQTVGQDLMYLSLAASGYITLYVESQNGGAIQTATFDIDAYYGDWVQMHIKWDTTRCADGAGDTCSDAGEDEVCIRWRIDANNDGDFGDGGVEDWSAYACEASAMNYKVWAAEPTTDDFSFGTTGTVDITVLYDDIQFSSSQPAW